MQNDQNINSQEQSLHKPEIKFKKPQLSSIKAKSQISKNIHEIIQRIEFFYRYKIISFSKVCKYFINEQLVNKQISKSNSKNTSKQSFIDLLNKNVMIKSKYRHREKIMFRRSPILKILKYDFLQLANKLKTKQFCAMYDDLDDEQDKKQQQEDQDIKGDIDEGFNIQAFKEYRAKHQILPNQKIFIIQGGYLDLVNYLKSRGWVENLQTDSLIFDFKFGSKMQKIDHAKILEHQIVNHFEKSGALTTKFGLCRSLKNLIHLNIDSDKFYPRCFDLYDSTQFEDWVQDFKFSKAISILKTAREIYKCEQKINKNKKLWMVCLLIVRKIGLKLQDKLKKLQNKMYPIVTSDEWNFLNQQKISQNLNKQIEQNFNNIQNLKLIQIIDQELNRLQKFDNQFNLNKANIWIVKPASRSRGRGIKVFSNLNQILDYIIGKQQIQWVVQKYIQNPLIIKNRKFDIRQWVVLSDFRPLRIWFYNQFYVRFSAQQYDLENIKNRFAHLTNNSIAKYSQSFDNNQIKGNMFFESEFFEYIQNKIGNTLLKTKLKKKMEEIVINSIKSASDIIKSRKNSIQMYGYDFMIDEDFNPWLIQINASPSMQYSTHVTQKLVKCGLQDFGKLICDYMCNKKVLKSQQTYGNWKLIYNQ